MFTSLQLKGQQLLFGVNLCGRQGWFLVRHYLLDMLNFSFLTTAIVCIITAVDRTRHHLFVTFLLVCVGALLPWVLTVTQLLLLGSLGQAQEITSARYYLSVFLRWAMVNSELSTRGIARNFVLALSHNRILQSEALLTDLLNTNISTVLFGTLQLLEVFENQVWTLRVLRW